MSDYDDKKQITEIKSRVSFKAVNDLIAAIFI